MYQIKVQFSHKAITVRMGSDLPASLQQPKETITDETSSSKNNSKSTTCTSTSSLHESSTIFNDIIESISSPLSSLSSLAKTPADESTTTSRGTTINRTEEEFKVSLYYDEWARCVGSSYQMDHVYRVGRFDTCRKQWDDVKTAMEVKLSTTDPKKCQELLDSTYYKKRTTISPTAGAIWELKERPGWD